MVSKLKADYQILQKRFSCKVESENNLVELLSKVRDGLELASRYYYEINEIDPNIVENLGLEKVKGFENDQ
ncbi:hypothetical protein HJ057_16670 [Vibrio parahaemolyticus]|nr:hypothetical protein [Vibrio parahaemolyticus]